MATKATKTTSTSKKPAAKATKAAAPRHPLAQRAAKGSKADVVKSLVGALAIEGQDNASLEKRLTTASNKKLMHLVKVSETVSKKFGSRAKLIDAIATSRKAGKDKDFVAKLGKLPLPQLLDMAGKR